MATRDLDERTLRRLVTRVETYFGRRWFRQQAAERPRRFDMKRPLDGAEPSHPVVAWYRNYKQWLKADSESQEQFLGGVLELATFAQALDIAAGMRGAHRLHDRLRRVDQFEAAAFELEVASNYAKVGWEVEFLEEGSEKSPDLRLFQPTTDAEVYVECKRRDHKTERDARIDNAWIQLGNRLINHMRRSSHSAQIELTWMRDPVAEDYDLIVELASRASSDADTVGVPKTLASPEAIEVIYTKLSEGEEFIAGALANTTRYAPDRFLLVSDMKKEKDGSTVWRCPIVLALRTEDPPDRVKGVIQSFKTARRQLPKGKPGVICIRVPDHAWTTESHFERAVELLKPKLQGQFNRRVNAVNLMTRELRVIQDGKRTGRSYSPLWTTVEHSNPATPFPDLPIRS